jgi:hypothetical protein
MVARTTMANRITRLSSACNLNHTYPVYTIRSWADAEARYGIQGVPVTYVIRANRIRYRGSLRGALQVLERGK